MQQTSSGGGSDSSNEVSLSDLFYKFLPYWPFFVILVLISLTGAYIYLRYKLPVYRSTATLLIKDDKKNSIDPLETFDLFGSKKNVENEIEVLKSKTLMQDVVKNLHLYAPVTVEGRLQNQSAYLMSPIVIEAKDPDSMRGVNKVPFHYNESDQTIQINQTTYSLNQWVSTPFGVLQFLPNKYYPYNRQFTKENKFYFSLISLKAITNGILSHLSVTESGKQTTVINLSIEGEIPRRGEDILNELLKVYNQAAILDKNVLAANTLKFVEDRLKYVVNELDSVEGKLQNYKSQNRIVDLSAQGQLFLQTVSANDQKISDINVQLAVLDQVEKYVKSKGAVAGIVPSTLGISDPALTDLLQKLSSLELQYTQLKKIVPENNPSLIAVQDGIEKLEPGILDNIINQRRNLLAGKADLSQSNNQYSYMLKSIPEKERELLGISRQQAIKNNIYTFLLQKREETALSFASAVADSRIIDKAESSDSPISPNRSRIYLIAFFVAMAFGALIITVKEMLTRTVQQRSEIEKYTNIPFLGQVNFDKSRSSIVITEGNRSYIAEQFRQLRTSLSYMGIDEAHKKILVTSSISGEGKSFIAINLGISLSLMRKKVVLIEMDLRKPKLTEQFNISRSTGLSNYLIGKMSSEDLIRNTGIENLYLIPAGPIPPNPSELISNGRVPELLQYLEKTFDYIIVDTAPINPVTDAFIISPLTDVTLFIVRHAYTPKVFLSNLAPQNNMKSLKNAAIIYNGVKGKGFNKYGYGYGYGYGYTEEDSKGKWWRNIFKRI